MYQSIIQTYVNNWNVFIHTYFYGMYFLELLPKKYCKIKKSGKVYYSTPYVHLKPLPNLCKFYKRTAFDACDISIVWNSVRYTVALQCAVCYVCTVQRVIFALCTVLCLHCALCYVCTVYCAVCYVCTVHCAVWYVFTVHCAVCYVCTVHCIVLCLQCAVCSAHHIFLSVTGTQTLHKKMKYNDL